MPSCQGRAAENASCEWCHPSRRSLPPIAPPANAPAVRRLVLVGEAAVVARGRQAVRREDSRETRGVVCRQDLLPLLCRDAKALIDRRAQPPHEGLVLGAPALLDLYFRHLDASGRRHGVVNFFV